MQIANRDIEKMIGYHAKGSNPDTLARTVKDLGKAKNRAVIAHAMGWNAAAGAFYDRCRQLGATDADMAEVDRMYDTYELPANYREKFDQGPKLEDSRRLRDWFPKLFKVLRDTGVETFTLKSRTPDRWEMEIDSRDGRCWTLAYTLDFDLDGQHYTWKIANHTNEGGGSFGVSGRLGHNEVAHSTQQALAAAAARELDLASAANESKENAYAMTSMIVESILSGADVRSEIIKFVNTRKLGTKE